MASTCGAIWDVDGTLVDTAQLHFAAWERLCGELGRAFTREDFSATFGRQNPSILEYLFPDRHRDLDVAELGDRKERYYRAAAGAGVTLLPGVRSLIDALAADGFKQAVGSSAPHANLDLILSLTGIRSQFDAIVGAEDARRGKPDPGVFLTAAARLSLPPARCVVFEDATVGIQAGRAAGMRVIAVSYSGHSSHEALARAGADLVVASLDSLAPADVRALFA